MMIKLVENERELHQILALQKENHPSNLCENKMQKKGFITVLHEFEALKKMNDKAAHIIAIDNDVVVAFALVMLKEFRNLVPMLIPMFTSFEQIQFQNRKLNTLNFYVMGQICVQDNFKRKGILKKLYLKHKEIYSDTFEYCVTEISSSNTPSMIAHQKIGFQTIHTFTDNTAEWNVMLWDWEEKQ